MGIVRHNNIGSNFIMVKYITCQRISLKRVISGWDLEYEQFLMSQEMKKSLYLEFKKRLTSPLQTDHLWMTTLQLVQWTVDQSLLNWHLLLNLTVFLYTSDKKNKKLASTRCHDPKAHTTKIEKTASSKTHSSRLMRFPGFIQQAKRRKEKKPTNLTRCCSGRE